MKKTLALSENSTLGQWRIFAFEEVKLESKTNFKRRGRDEKSKTMVMIPVAKMSELEKEQKHSFISDDEWHRTLQD